MSGSSAVGTHQIKTDPLHFDLLRFHTSVGYEATVNDLSLRTDSAKSRIRSAMTPEKALEILKSGNARFVPGKTTRRTLPAQVRATASGQNPFGAIVSCMDSRVPVELVFDLTVGDAFSLRVAGNVINPDILGSLEYATKVAGAKVIVVLGHTRCGAVKSAIDGIQLGNLTGILARIVPPHATTVAETNPSKDHADVDRVTEQ